jgi:hypothetical protein
MRCRYLSSRVGKGRNAPGPRKSFGRTQFDLSEIGGHAAPRRFAHPTADRNSREYQNQSGLRVPFRGFFAAGNS